MARLQPALFPEIEGPDFTRSEAIDKVGQAVLSKHGKAGGALFEVARAARDEEIRILWLRNDKPFDPEKDDEGHDVVGKCVKAPRLWHDVTGYDVAIWLRGWFFDRWSEQEQEAFTLHELLHIEIKRDKDGQAKVAVAKHDVEDFVAVVRHYGTVVGDSARYVRAATVQPAKDESEGCPFHGCTLQAEHAGDHEFEQET